MKYFPGFFLLIAMVYGSSCSGPATQKQQAADSVKAEKKEYFPVLDYLRGEIAYVDSFPMKIMLYRTAGAHKDSSQIGLPAYHELVKEILTPELEKDSFEKYFSESSFLDQTSQSLTFTYSANNGRLRVTRVDVLASPSPGLDQVKSIYIEKRIPYPDSTILEKLYWKPKRNLQVIRIRELPGQPDASSQWKLVWDNRD